MDDPRIMTENAYALCVRHANQWRDGGWNGAMYPIEECCDGDELAQMVCADCEYAADIASGLAQGPFRNAIG